MPALRRWQSVVVVKQPARRIGAEAAKTKHWPSKKSIWTTRGGAMIAPILEPLSKTATTNPRSLAGKNSRLPRHGIKKGGLPA